MINQGHHFCFNTVKRLKSFKNSVPFRWMTSPYVTQQAVLAFE